MKAPIHHDEVYERIQKVTGTRTQNDLAQLLEIKQSSISEAKKRDSIPADWFLTLFEKLDINPRWLKYGTGPRFLRTKEENCIEEDVITTNVGSSSYSSSLILPAYTTVYSMSVHMDKTMLSPVGIDKIVLPQFYLKDGISVFYVQSGALSPVILKGSYVGIQRSERSPVSGEIFALFVPQEGIILGYLFYHDKQSPYVIRNNAATYSITPDEVEFRIIGKLDWVVQKI